MASRNRQKSDPARSGQKCPEISQNPPNLVGDLRSRSRVSGGNLKVKCPSVKLSQNAMKPWETLIYTLNDTFVWRNRAPVAFRESSRHLETVKNPTSPEPARNGRKSAKIRRNWSETPPKPWPGLGWKFKSKMPAG